MSRVVPHSSLQPVITSHTHPYGTYSWTVPKSTAHRVSKVRDHGANLHVRYGPLPHIRLQFILITYCTEAYDPRSRPVHTSTAYIYVPYQRL